MNRQERRAAERLRLKQERKDRRDQPAPVETVSAAATVSDARLEANRANAQRNTGPKTIEGKTASAQNSFKHGLYSKQLVPKSENPAELDALKADLRAEHQPATLTEEIMVNEMAEHYWRIRRARLAEAQFLGTGGATAQMNAIARLMSSAERGFHKSLKTLRELQKQRGFVPQNEKNAPPQVTNQPGKSAASAPIGTPTVSSADMEWDEFETDMAAAFPEVAAEIAAEEAAAKQAAS